MTTEIKPDYLGLAERLYNQGKTSCSIDSIQIPIDMEQLIMQESQAWEQDHPNDFLRGVLEYYHTHGFVSDRQWFYVIKMWIRFTSYERPRVMQQIQFRGTQSPQLKHMLEKLKKQAM